MTLMGMFRWRSQRWPRVHDLGEAAQIALGKELFRRLDLRDAEDKERDWPDCLIYHTLLNERKVRPPDDMPASFDCQQCSLLRSAEFARCQYKHRDRNVL